MRCHIHVFKKTRCVTHVNLIIPSYFTHQITSYTANRGLIPTYNVISQTHEPHVIARKIIRVTQNVHERQ
jgi:hypothetical protein